VVVERAGPLGDEPVEAADLSDRGRGHSLTLVRKSRHVQPRVSLAGPKLSAKSLASDGRVGIGQGDCGG
jgi:hypothetical protein